MAVRSPHSVRDSACVGVFRLGSLDSTGLLKLVISFAIFFAFLLLARLCLFRQSKRRALLLLLLRRCASVHPRGEQVQRVTLILACEMPVLMSASTPAIRQC